MKGVGLLILGMALGWGPQEIERYRDRKAMNTLYSLDAELRQASAQVRASCPSTPRTRSLVFRQGEPA